MNPQSNVYIFIFLLLDNVYQANEHSPIEFKLPRQLIFQPIFHKHLSQSHSLAVYIIHVVRMFRFML